MDYYYHSPPRKVIIDTDAGPDDAVALFLALGAHKNPKIPFEIIGITTVLGNTSVENVGRNVFIVLDSAGVDNIPVYGGAATPLVQPFVRGQSPTFDEDGFGGVQSSPNLPVVRRKRELEKESAALALIRLAKEHQGELTLVALGPLTNLAICINLDPNFVKNIKEIHIMGGNMHGVGNIRPCCEFNFFVDPESAFVVLASAWNQKIVLTPWETCKLAGTTPEWRIQEMGSIKTKQIELLNLVEKKVLAEIHKGMWSRKWVSADTVCVAALLNPKIISSLTTNYCTVELQGSHTRGQMVLDHPQKTGMSHNVSIIEQVNSEEFQKMVMCIFQKGFSS